MGKSFVFSFFVELRFDRWQDGVSNDHCVSVGSRQGEHGGIYFMDRKPCGEKLPVLCQKNSVHGNNIYSWTKYCTEGRRNIESWMEDKDGDCSDLCKFEMLQTIMDA